MYHPHSGYSESVLSSLGLSHGTGGGLGAAASAAAYQPADSPFGLAQHRANLSSSGDPVYVVASPSAAAHASGSHGAAARPTTQSQGGQGLLAASSLSTPYKPPRGGAAFPSPSAHALLNSDHGAQGDPFATGSPFGATGAGGAGGLAEQFNATTSSLGATATLGSGASVVSAPPAAPLTACAFLLFVLGPPGAGKSAVCARLSSELGFVHLDVQALLSAEIKVGSNTGRLVSDFLRLGQPVPGEVVADLLKHHVGRCLAGNAAPTSSSSSGSAAAAGSSMTSSGNAPATPLQTFFAIEHFPSDAVAWRAWQKHMNSGMMRVMRAELKGKAGGGLASAIELRAPSSVCVDRLTRRGQAGDDSATIDRRVANYDAQVAPLIADLSRFSLAIVAKVQSQVPLESLWIEVKAAVSNMVVRLSLTPPLPSSLVPFHTPRARTRVWPVFVLGGPGSGRSMLCRRLAEELGMIHLNFEEVVLRASVEQEDLGLAQGESNVVAGTPGHGQTPLQIMSALMALSTTGHETERAARVAGLLKENRPIPADLACELLLQPLRHHLARGHTQFLIDGYPQAADQWKALLAGLWGVDADLDPSLASSLTNHVTGFYLECPERIRHSRLLRRRSAKDSPRTIEQRMRLYESSTLPLEVALMNQSPRSLFRIQAGLSEGEVFREVCKRLVLSIATRIDTQGTGLGTLGTGIEVSMASKAGSNAANDATTAAHLRALKARNASAATTAGGADVVYKLGGTHSFDPSAPAALRALGAGNTAAGAQALIADPRRRPLARLIFLFGPPGSGTSSLATSLAGEMELVHLDLDNLVNRAIANRGVHRAAILQHLQMQQASFQSLSASSSGTNLQGLVIPPPTPFGDQVLLPSHIALDLLSESLEEYLKAGVGFFVVTGFPASIGHKEAFESTLGGQVSVVRSFLLEVAPAAPAGAAANNAAIVPASSGPAAAAAAAAASAAALALQSARDSEAQRVCMDRLSLRGDHFEDASARLKIFWQNTKPLLDALCKQPEAKSGNGVVKAHLPGSIGSFMDAPLFLLHAGSKVSKPSVLDQAALYLTDLSYLRTPASAKKAVSKAMVFVLLCMGGPGAGKASITSRILHDYDFTHLSIDELLNEEIESGSAEGLVLQSVFLHGGALPSETVALVLRRALQARVAEGRTHFLVSGFPIDEMGWAAWREVMGSNGGSGGAGADVPTALYLDCPEEIRRERLLARGESESAIRSSFQFFRERTVPLIDSLSSRGTVLTISSMEGLESVYTSVQRELEVLLHSLRAPSNPGNLGATKSLAPLFSSSARIDATTGGYAKLSPLEAARGQLARSGLEALAGGNGNAAQAAEEEGGHEAKTYVLGRRAPQLALTAGLGSGQSGAGFASPSTSSGGTFPSNYHSVRYNLLFVFSAPGSGRGTLLRRLKSELGGEVPVGPANFDNVHVVSLREMLPRTIASGSALGRTIGAHLRASLSAREADLAAMVGVEQARIDVARIDPLTLLSSSLQAQLLQSHLETLLLAQEEAEYKLRTSQPSAAGSLASLSGVASKINVLVDGAFPRDERGWEEFLALMASSSAAGVAAAGKHASAAGGSGGNMDLRGQVVLVAPEVVRLERLRRAGRESAAEIASRCQEFNNQLAPLLRKLGSSTAAAVAAGVAPLSGDTPSLVEIDARPSADLVYLQFLSVLQAKFGAWAAQPLAHQGGEQVWRHPYGLRRRDGKNASAGVPASLVPAASSSVANASRPVFALFLFGAPGSGRSTLSESLTSVSSSSGARQRDLELRQWNLLELDVLALAEAERRERPGGKLAAQVRKYLTERNSVLLKDVKSLSPDPLGPDVRALCMPPSLSIALLLAALRFHTAKLSNFAFLIRNFPQDKATWEEWEAVTTGAKPADGGDKSAASHASLESKLRPMGLWLDAPPPVRSQRLQVGRGHSALQVAQADFQWTAAEEPLVSFLSERGNIVRIDSGENQSDVVVLASAKEAIRKLMAEAERPVAQPSVGVEDIHRSQAELGAATGTTMVPRSLGFTAGASASGASALSQVMFVLGAPGAGVHSFCRHLSGTAFSLNPRNVHEPLVRWKHLDVEELYGEYMAAHPSARIEDHVAGGSSAKAGAQGGVQPRNTQLTIYLLRQALLKYAPSLTSSSALLSALPSDAEDASLGGLGAEESDVLGPAPPHMSAPSSEAPTTLFVLSGFPRDMAEWAGWQDEIEMASTSSGGGQALAKLAVVLHLDADLLTCSKRVLSRSGGERGEQVARQRAHAWQYQTLPVLDALSTASAGGSFGVVRVHAAPPLHEVLPEALAQLRKRNVFAAAVEGEQLRLGRAGETAGAGGKHRPGRAHTTKALTTSSSSGAGMVGSQGQIYSLGESQSALTEIQGLLDQMPRVAAARAGSMESVVANLIFVVGPPGSGCSSHSSRAGRNFHGLSVVHLETLLAGEVSSGSRRGVLIANQRAERKPVSRLVRIILLLQQIVALSKGHVASARAAASASGAQAFLPSDDGGAEVVSSTTQRIDPLPILVAGFPANRAEWFAWQKILGMLEEKKGAAAGEDGEEEEEKSSAALSSAQPSPLDPSRSISPLAPLRNLAFIVLDVDAEASISRLLRGGGSTLAVEARWATFKAGGAPLIRELFQSTQGRVATVNPSSDLPRWDEDGLALSKVFGENNVGKSGSSTVAFALDARKKEQEVYDAFATIVAQYLHRTRIATGSAAGGATAGSKAGFGSGSSQVYTVGAPLDPRPPMAWMLLLGAPGAGCKTYLQRLRARYDFEVLDLAALVLQELRKRGTLVTPDTRAVAYHHQQRLLLPADLALRLLMTSALAANSLGKSQFLVVGFPQTIAQWELLQASPEMSLGTNGGSSSRLTLRKILFLDTPEKERLERLETALASGALDGPEHLPGASGGPVTAEDVAARVSNYNTQTKKAMSELLAKGLLERVSSKSLNTAAALAARQDALTVPEQVSQIFEKLCEAHVDPIWRFLRRESAEEARKAADSLARATAAGHRSNQSVAAMVALKPTPPAEEKYDPAGSNAGQMAGQGRMQPTPPPGKSPFSAAVAGGTPSVAASLSRDASRGALGTLSSPQAPGKLKSSHTLFVLFLMGGAGAGRRTMARRLASLHPDHYEDVDMSALETAEVGRATEAGKTILAARQYGRVPPAPISLLLLNRALKHAAVNDKRLALVHGFPEDVDAWKGWQNAYGDAAPAVLYLVCPDNVREARLMNEHVPLYQIKTRQSLFANYTLPLIDLLAKTFGAQAVQRISALASMDKVYELVNHACAGFLEGVRGEIHVDKHAAALAAEAAAKAHADRAAAASAALVAAQPHIRSFPSVAAKAARSQLEGEYLFVHASASNLEKPAFFSTVNAYCEFFRFVPRAGGSAGGKEEESKTQLSLAATPVSTSGGRWEKIYQSPVVFNSLSPEWKPFLLDNDVLSGRNTLAPLLLVVWSWAKGEAPKFLASVQTSVRELMECAAAPGAGADLRDQPAKALTLTRAVQLTPSGIVSAESGGGGFLANKTAPAGSLRIHACTRLVYRPVEEVLAAAPRPPTAGSARSQEQLAPAQGNSGGMIAVAVVGSAGSSAMSQATAGGSASGFASVHSSALLAASQRQYEASSCVVRLCMLGEYLESKGWSAGASAPGSRDTLATLTAGSQSAGNSKARCDPFVELYGLDHDPSSRKPLWRLSYTSEVVENSRSPKWNLFVLRLWELCRNDYYRPLLLKVWDASALGGAPEFVGEAQTNLKEILVKAVGQARFELVHPARRLASNNLGAQPSGAYAVGGPQSSPFEHAGSLIFSYARVFSDVRYSQIERTGAGFPADVLAFQNRKPVPPQ